jgi:hypothetical protein
MNTYEPLQRTILINMADTAGNFLPHYFHYHDHVSETVNLGLNFDGRHMEQVLLEYQIVAYQGQSQHMLEPFTKEIKT